MYINKVGYYITIANSKKMFFVTKITKNCISQNRTESKNTLCLSKSSETFISDIIYFYNTHYQQFIIVFQDRKIVLAIETKSNCKN